jgi:hypothetical protein
VHALFVAALFETLFQMTELMTENEPPARAMEPPKNHAGSFVLVVAVLSAMVVDTNDTSAYDAYSAAPT